MIRFATFLFVFILVVCCPTRGTAETYICTVKDVIEITRIGTLGRRPTLTQTEMTLHPSFVVNTTTGVLRSDRPEFDGKWPILLSSDAQNEFTTLDVAVGKASDQSLRQLLRIRTQKGGREALFLWFSSTNLKAGSCEAEQP